MTILITGAHGMVGKNISEHKTSKLFRILNPTSSELDLLNIKAVDDYLKNKKPEIIIHCAGKVGGIQANMKEPIRFLVENLEIGKNLILSARKNGIKKLINLGSSCMYPKDGDNPLKELSILNGHLEPTNEGYAIAKITSAKLCEYITKENNDYKYKTLIPCNLFGKYDNFNPQHSHLVPAIIHKLHSAKVDRKDTVEIWGDGLARREFMYASDFADCIWRCIEYFDTLPQYMNVGLGQDWSINEYYKTAAKVIGFKGKFVHNLSRPVGMKQKLVDITALKKWGWKPKFSLEDSLQITYDFYLKGLQ